MDQEIISNGVEFYIGSGNVFADLELPNPEELQLKANLSIEIEQIIKKKRLTRKQAAALLGLSQQELADLFGRGFADLSISQLIQYLHCLGQEVELSVSVSKRQPQKARKTVAAT